MRKTVTYEAADKSKGMSAPEIVQALSEHSDDDTALVRVESSPLGKVKKLKVTHEA